MPDSNQNRPTLSWTTPADHPPTPILVPKPAPVAPQERRFGWWFPAACGFVGGIATVLIWQYLVMPPPVTDTVANVVTSSTNTPTAGKKGSSVEEVPSAGYSRDRASAASPQEPGRSVFLTSVAVSAPTWAVVYEERNGMPGNALGARLFLPGEASGAVSLLRATEGGKRYFVGLQT